MPQLIGFTTVFPSRTSIGSLSKKMKALTPHFQKVRILFKIEPLACSA